MSWVHLKTFSIFVDETNRYAQREISNRKNVPRTEESRALWSTLRRCLFLRGQTGNWPGNVTYQHTIKMIWVWLWNKANVKQSGWLFVNRNMLQIWRIKFYRHLLQWKKGTSGIRSYFKRLLNVGIYNASGIAWLPKEGKQLYIYKIFLGSL
jgi:hypothetical protein